MVFKHSFIKTSFFLDVRRVKYAGGWKTEDGETPLLQFGSHSGPVVARNPGLEDRSDKCK